MSELIVTRYEVRQKLLNILTDLTLEMVETQDKEKMQRLHNAGMELDAISHKFVCGGKHLTYEELLEMNESLDAIFANLVLEEIVSRLHKGKYAPNKVSSTPRSGVRAERLRLLSLYSGSDEQHRAG